MLAIFFLWVFLAIISVDEVTSMWKWKLNSKLNTTVFPKRFHSKPFVLVMFLWVTHFLCTNIITFESIHTCFTLNNVYCIILSNRGVARVSQRYEMKSLLVKTEWKLTSLFVINTSPWISDWLVYFSRYASVDSINTKPNLDIISGTFSKLKTEFFLI